MGAMVVLGLLLSLGWTSEARHWLQHRVQAEAVRTALTDAEKVARPAAEQQPLAFSSSLIVVPREIDPPRSKREITPASPRAPPFPG